MRALPEGRQAEEPPIDAPEEGALEAVEDTFAPTEEPLSLQPATSVPTGDALSPDMAAWTEAIHSVEQRINDAVEAIRYLRETLQEMAPVLRSIGALEDALGAFAETPRRSVRSGDIDMSDPWSSRTEELAEPATAHPADVGRLSESQGRKKSAAREKTPRWEDPDRDWTPPSMRSTLKPVTLVPDDTPAPFAYKLTVEDRKNSVELMKLHQALTSIPSVRNVILLNYAGGVASLTLEAMDEVQPSELENAVHKVMKRSCSVVPHESNTILVQVGD